ncbi:MAG: NUDIX domain-containing protein [Rickettsiales bacterium]|nr:NUDIX domain-containing protein [Rickettsiales bacterium]
MKKERYKITTAVYAVIMRNGQLLLSLRRNTGFMDGKYSLVSGHLEANETLSEAMVREAREEANITIERMHIGTTLFRFGASPEFDDYIDFFFIVDDFSGEILNNEPEKCEELRFFPLDAYPDNMVDYVRYCLENLERGVMYCEWPPAGSRSKTGGI